MNAIALKTISRRELQQYLCTIQGSTFCTIDYEVPVVLKPIKPVGKLPRRLAALKRATANVNINFYYVPGVLRRLDKEGKPETAFRQGESWHQLVTDKEGRATPFAQHKVNGEVYFRCQHISTIGEPVYVEETSDGYRPVEGSVSAIYKQQEGGNYENQGLDSPLRFLTFRFEHLKAITIGGIKYLIEDEKPVAPEPAQPEWEEEDWGYETLL